MLASLNSLIRLIKINLRCLEICKLSLDQIAAKEEFDAFNAMRAKFDDKFGEVLQAAVVAKAAAEKAEVEVREKAAEEKAKEEEAKEAAKTKAEEEKAKEEEKKGPAEETKPTVQISTTDDAKKPDADKKKGDDDTKEKKEGDGEKKDEEKEESDEEPEPEDDKEKVEARWKNADHFVKLLIG